jgi:hypothetical protein
MTVLAGSTVLLALAWFAAINAAASLVCWVLAIAFVRSRVDGWGAVALALRLLPAAASMVFVSLLFAPSHWWFEPRGSQETFGVLVYALAGAAAVMLARSAWRAARMLRADRGLSGREDAVDGLSLAGLLRTRILIGPTVASALTTAELDVAMAHEHAHGLAYDNLKRFLIACAPDFFGVSRAARALEDRWRASAESLADARAVNGDERRAVHLASALVKVARIGLTAPAPTASPAWSTLNDPPLLEIRVRRLVAGTAPVAAPPALARGLTVIVAGTLGLGVSGAAAASAIHRTTEALIRWLP